MTSGERARADQGRTGDEAAFDRLVDLACSLFQAPIVLISVLQGDRAVFRSNVTVSHSSIDREASVSHVLAAMGPGATLVVEDAQADERFCKHPLVTGPDRIRAYFGAAITLRDGRTVGGLSVLDRKPRTRPDDRSLEQLKLLAGMAADILDQTEAYRIIDEQLGVLKMAEQMSGVGNWRLDIASGSVNWSDEVYRIHGVTAETFDPRYDDAVAFYHPDDRAEVRDCINRCIGAGEPYEFKLRIVRADGEERVVMSRGRAERGPGGVPSAVYGVFQDVTEAETAHARIVDSEARYRLLAEMAEDIIISYGVDGIVTYVSPSIEAASGRAPAEIVGRPVTDLILPEDVPALAESFRRLVKSQAGERPEGMQYRGLHRDGGTHWFEARTSVIRDESGRAVAFHDVVRDITATKTLEAELIASRDVAERAARAKSEFLANMSHELRTPLTSVIGFSGLLQDSEALPETERRYADLIATASEALLGVINDILDYSKLEAEAVDLDPRPFDPAETARGAAAMVEAQCQAKGVALELDLDPDLPQALMGDEGRIRQVLLNFLSNAMKFTVSGAVRIAVARRDERLRIAVSDSGIGIAADKIDALFERFTQADASTTRVYGGTGLGLAISRRLIGMMGGEIGATSRPGEGSTFWFEISLPVADSAAAMPTGEVQALPPGLRVLMADDAPANRELVRIILEGWEVQLQTVDNGAEAVQAAGQGEYDLILMDVHMPVMDGMDATRRIRALPGTAGRVPILALTANVQPDQVEACRQAGMTAHVGKPIQVGELIGAMAQALARAGSDVAERAA